MKDGGIGNRGPYLFHRLLRCLRHSFDHVADASEGDIHAQQGLDYLGDPSTRSPVDRREIGDSSVKPWTKRTQSHLGGRIDAGFGSALAAQFMTTVFGANRIDPRKFKMLPAGRRRGFFTCFRGEVLPAMAARSREKILDDVHLFRRKQFPVRSPMPFLSSLSAARRRFGLPGGAWGPSEEGGLEEFVEFEVSSAFRLSRAVRRASISISFSMTASSPLS